MDAVEILGAILGKKSGSAGSGGGVLKDILGGVLGGKASAPPAPRRQPEPPRQRSPQPRAGGGDLETMVRDAYSKYQRRQSGGQRTPQPEPTRRHEPVASSELDNEQAVVLIRAMVNAAKADGQLDQREQDSIVKQLGEVSQDEVQFLQKEFTAPLDVREFAWSVPLGLEQQVYGISLMAIKLDKNTEAHYLKELAHGLRLAPDVCDGIHQQFNAPTIYS